MVDWLSPAIIFPQDHAVIGALAVATAYAFAPGRLGDPARAYPGVPRGAVAAFAVLILLKELLWDPANELGQPFLWAGATDLFYYFAGIGVMLGALWARFRRL
ncbi:MAG: hypothetical protein L3J97_05235 [Thermoplasmata archaeon]|nr:hypothetical protein [Thermoplasmata archaeon]